jgi:hypothetical protein
MATSVISGLSENPALLPDRETARWPLPANLAFLRIPHYFLTVKQLDGHFLQIWPF